MNRNLEALFLTLLWKVICRLPEPWSEKSTGRPPYEPKAVALACMAKVMFNKTYEGAESWTKSSKLFHELAGYSKIPQSVIHRGMARMPPRYIRRVCKMLAAQAGKKGIEGIIDSSGFRLRTSSSWYDIRIHRKSKRRDHIKLHIIGNYRTGIIHSLSITGGHANDSPQVKVLLKEIGKLLKLAGDAGYPSRKNCTLVAEKGGKPFFMLKKNVPENSRPKSHVAWKIMVRFFHNKRKKWLKEYHVRSFVEAIFSSLKKRFGNFLRSIKRPMQKKELSLKVLCYNAIRVLFIERAKELGIPLWVRP